MEPHFCGTLVNAVFFSLHRRPGVSLSVTVARVSSEAANPLIRQRNFLRVSYDRSGRLRSPIEQDTVLARDAERDGRTVVGPAYSEVGSASRYALTERDEFPLLLEDLRAGTFGAEVLGLWETSRGTRQMEQSLPLINALARAGVRVWVHSLRRLLDPRRPHDRADLLSAAVRDELASAETSERVLRSVESEAMSGAPHGLAPFGYRHEYDPLTGDLIGRVIHEQHAGLVREVFTRTLAGESMKSIAGDFKGRGIMRPIRKAADGSELPTGPYTPQHLATWLRNPAYAGLRRHDVGGRGRKAVGPNAKLYEADWLPIIDRETWHRMEIILAHPNRTKIRPGRARHLLGGIAVCAVCGGTMVSAPGRGAVGVYRCGTAGHVTIPRDGVDALARELLATYIAERAYLAMDQGDTGSNEALQLAETAVKEAEAEIAKLKANVRTGRLSIDFAADVESGLQARRTAAKIEVARLTPRDDVRGLVDSLIAPGDDVRARLDHVEPAVWRNLARLIFVERFVGRAQVLRAPKVGVATPAHNRLHFHRGEKCRTGPCSVPETNSRQASM